MRKPIIAGNWKMNNDIFETEKLMNTLLPLVAGAEAEVVFCPTYLGLQKAVEMAKDSNVGIGAQNMHFEKSGAYTGEVSGEMLQAIGVKYVLIGHSERREYFNETDETVNKKAIKALSLGITPIVCCGETLEERESGKVHDQDRSNCRRRLRDPAHRDRGRDRNPRGPRRGGAGLPLLRTARGSLVPGLAALASDLFVSTRGHTALSC
jgi:triosephosphate isomerase